VHLFEFDDLGRITQDRVVTLGTGVDGAVRRLATTYDVRGLVANQRSYDNAAVGPGSVLNEVAYEYNDIGQLIEDAQSHAGAKGGGTLSTHYVYATGINNHVRPTTMTYPDGRELHVDYGATDSTADLLNRPAGLIYDNGTTKLVAYSDLILAARVPHD